VTSDVEPPPLAVEHLRAGRYQEAMAVCRERLAEDPADRGALRLLARSLMHLNQIPLAVLLLEQALKPGDEPTLLADLGDALAAAGSDDSAADAYGRALAGKPAGAEPHFGLLELGRRADLEARLRSAAESDPDDAAVHFALANVLLESEEPASARQAFERAVALDPRFAGQHARMGASLAMKGQHERAARMYRWGLALNPGDPELRHLCEALEGHSAAERASDAYLTQVFDGFADTFEETLERLEYRGPELVVGALRNWLPPPGRELTMLDAGCGTGLCGPLLRPLAARLVGIDLSPRMLELAHASGSYDELRRQELVEGLTRDRGVYDAIVAADVLIYFGALEELLGASADALRPGGVFAFNIEREAQRGYALRSSGRYAHSPEYIRSAAESAGLIVRDMRDGDLRLEAGRPVAGVVAVLEAPRA
jgi:predicted TPR repeat methyltransferase